jgi:hypothetical protein
MVAESERHAFKKFVKCMTAARQSARLADQEFGLGLIQGASDQGKVRVDGRVYLASAAHLATARWVV